MDIFVPELEAEDCKDLRWKIYDDPFYKDLYETYGIDFIKNAGFIYDTNASHHDMTKISGIDCTPIHHVKNELDKIKSNKFYLKKEALGKPCVLLSTGSFCPIHQGHIEMMYKAKQACEDAGYIVLGGYFAPDHDEYVGVKNGSENIPINERIAIINDKLVDHEWLNVDPWAGLFGKAALNFTDIYERLRILLFRKFDQEIKVFFVCGSDNNRLSLTFINRGNCVVVSRPGYDGRQLGTYNFLLRRAMEEKRILYIENDNPLSSTMVRSIGVKPRAKKEKYYIRTTGEDERESKIVDLFVKRGLDISLLKLEEQVKNFKRIKAPLISIDSLLPSKFNLPISRGFDKFGIKFLYFIMRPEFEQEIPIKQISLPRDKKSYFLFDDDIHSGGTMAHASTVMSKMGIKVAGIISLTRSQKDEEILDARDFFYETENCGLAIYNHQGDWERAIYAYPFVDPYVRASISDPLIFSMEVWKINMDYYADKDSLKYGECKKYYDWLSDLC